MIVDLFWETTREDRDGTVRAVKGMASLGEGRDGHVYSIYAFGQGWTYERREGLSLGPLSLAAVKGEAATYDEAHKWAEDDWNQLQSIAAWLTFMAANPPPSR